MTKLLQVNITANWGSHGKIAEAIGQTVLAKGWESYIAYGRWFNTSASQLYHIGNDSDEYIHGLGTRLFDCHGLLSRGATKRFVHFVESICPDIIHLHNIHGYYLNYPILFDFLAKYGKPVVWTLHDCWAYTGHCAHYIYVGCEKWKSHCVHCALKANYPKSNWRDRSYQNFEAKRAAFLSVRRLTLVPVSKWLEGEIQSSFLKELDMRQIYNGIDATKFHIDSNIAAIKTKYGIPQQDKMILGIASNWYRKGLEDFISLSRNIGDGYSIVLVGLNDKQRKSLPKRLIGLKRTENIQELCKLYSAANVLFNPTKEDNFPTVNLESMACGTPVVAYNTGGSAECLGLHTGESIERGNLAKALESIKKICAHPKIAYSAYCRDRVEECFSNETMTREYWRLYQELISGGATQD